MPSPLPTSPRWGEECSSPLGKSIPSPGRGGSGWGHKKEGFAIPAWKVAAERVGAVGFLEIYKAYWKLSGGFAKQPASQPASQSPPAGGRSVPFPAGEASPPQEGEGQGGGTRRKDLLFPPGKLLRRELERWGSWKATRHAESYLVDAQSRPASQSPPSWGRSVLSPLRKHPLPRRGRVRVGAQEEGLLFPQKKRQIWRREAEMYWGWARGCRPKRESWAWGRWKA
jgi:hypothetical protein